MVSRQRFGELAKILSWCSPDLRNGLRGDKGAFRNLIRPRENVVRYGATRAFFADDLAAATDGRCTKAAADCRFCSLATCFRLTH